MMSILTTTKQCCLLLNSNTDSKCQKQQLKSGAGSLGTHWCVTQVLALLLVLLVSPLGKAQGEMPSREEMWRTIQEQAKEIKELKEWRSRMNNLEKKVSSSGRKLETLSGTVKETGQRLESVAQAAESSMASPLRDVSIGGYGELHYNNLKDQHGPRDKEEIDFHRFVLFLGHEFNERIRLFSELEVEHAYSGDGKPGAVELEQAYIEMDIGDEARHRAKAGLFLVPVGLLNETHEPPTFYGVERNSVEKNIIPTTWWEGGLALSGTLSETIRYDLAYTSGLAVDAGYKIRGGRQKVAKAAATDGALTGRLLWKQSGMELGTTLHYQNDLTQDGANGAPERSDGLLFEAHTAIEKDRFGLRALYARWELDADSAESLGRDVQQGWFVEPSFKATDQFGLFTRYSSWDNEAGNSGNSEVREWSVGANYYPHENVVLKLDYQDQDAPSGMAELDGINLGVGYQF